MDEECFESSLVRHAVNSAEVAELLTNLSLTRLVNCNHQTAMIEIFQSQQITTTISRLITSAKENATASQRNIRFCHSFFPAMCRWFLDPNCWWICASWKIQRVAHWVSNFNSFIAVIAWLFKKNFNSQAVAANNHKVQILIDISSLKTTMATLQTKMLRQVTAKHTPTKSTLITWRNCGSRCYRLRVFEPDDSAPIRNNTHFDNTDSNTVGWRYGYPSLPTHPSPTSPPSHTSPP